MGHTQTGQNDFELAVMNKVASAVSQANSANNIEKELKTPLKMAENGNDDRKEQKSGVEPNRPNGDLTQTLLKATEDGSNDKKGKWTPKGVLVYSLGSLIPRKGALWSLLGSFRPPKGVLHSQGSFALPREFQCSQGILHS